MAPLNFLNPVALGTANTASKLSTRIKTDGTALSTGFADPTVDIARTSIARNLSSSAAIQKSVQQSLQSALGLINAALNELLSAREQVDSMKSIIIQAKNAPADVLTGLDNMYRKILQSVQNKLTAATYNGKLLFDGNLNQDVRIGEATTNTMNITLPKLTREALNTTHILDLVDLNTNNTVRFGWRDITAAYVPAPAAGVAASTVAGIDFPDTTAAGPPNEFVTALDKSGMGSTTITAVHGRGMLVVQTAGDGYEANKLAGGLNTLLPIKVDAAGAATVTIANGQITFGNGYVGAVNNAGKFFQAAGVIDSNETQTIAENTVTNLGKYLDKAITDVRAQQQVANLASTSLSDSIKVAQETADDLGRVDIPTTMADLVNSIKSLQGAVLAQALGGKVADALLELLRSA